MSTSNQYDEHYLAIGRMLVLFQSLEATLKHGLVLLMNNQSGTSGGQLVYATVSELSFGTATRLASAIPSIFTPERVGHSDSGSLARLEESLADAARDLTQGLKLANEAEQRRNQLVHSHWFISPGFVSPEGTMTRMKTKTRSGSVSTAFESESIADVDANTAKCREAQRLVGQALGDYRQIVQFKW